MRLKTSKMCPSGHLYSYVGTEPKLAATVDGNDAR